MHYLSSMDLFPLILIDQLTNAWPIPLQACLRNPTPEPPPPKKRGGVNEEV